MAAWILRLREGVAFLRRPSRDGGVVSEFVVEDQTRDKFYRIGQREYAILSRINGSASLEAIVAEARRGEPTLDLTDEQVLEIGRWLLTTGLGHLTAHPTQGEAERAEAVRLQSRLSWLNPVSMKFTLGNPDRFLDALLPLTRWLLGGAGAILGVVIALMGALVLLTEWDRFTAEMRGILGPDRWWLLLVVWFGLKGIHELAHGLVCKKYGGHVREWGVLFILFAPLGAWVNVTSSWKFASRWQRIHVAAAGMLCEGVLAGLAAIAWSHCEPGMLRHTLQNTVILASVITVLFNMNPLMRFDGYFILCEWLQIPNLAGRGQLAVSRQWQRVLLGVQRPSTEQGRFGRHLFIAAYGWAALYWRVLTGLGILIACSVLLHGFGFMLAVSGALLSYAWPLLRTVQRLAGNVESRPRPWRAALGLIVAAGLITALFTVIPWPGQRIAHGVIDYSQRIPIRAEASGFVERVAVQAGETVIGGELLFCLRNPELHSEIAIHEAQLAEAQHRSQYFLAEGTMAAFHSEEERLAAIQERVEESRQRLAGLKIIAPHDGRVLARDLDPLVGQWVERGTLLCEIGSDDAKEVLYAVPQHEVTNSTALTSGPVLSTARMIPCGATDREVSVTLNGFRPTAEWQPPHPALSGHLGGPLSVQPISDGSSQSPRWQLLRPHLIGRAVLTPKQSLQVRSGERVGLALSGDAEPLGKHVWTATTEWVEAKVESAWQMSEMR